MPLGEAIGWHRVLPAVAAAGEVTTDRSKFITCGPFGEFTAHYGSANLIVQINNSYYGQVRQVAANVWSSHVSKTMCKNIIVCDQDVDIYDLN